jgi:hypothetical protein
LAIYLILISSFHLSAITEILLLPPKATKETKLKIQLATMSTLLEYTSIDIGHLQTLPSPSFSHTPGIEKVHQTVLPPCEIFRYNKESPQKSLESLKAYARAFYLILIPSYHLDDIAEILLRCKVTKAKKLNKTKHVSSSNVNTTGARVYIHRASPTPTPSLPPAALVLK